MSPAIFPTVVLLTVSTSASAQMSTTGEYACVVHEKAGVASIHLEDAGPPEAYMESGIQTTFGMKIDQTSNGSSDYRVTETLNLGDNPDLMDYQSKFTLLHSAYDGDGMNFVAQQDLAFLRLVHSKDGGLYFYHAGFEYPGGEDVRLSARYGECKPKG